MSIACETFGQAVFAKLVLIPHDMRGLILIREIKYGYLFMYRK